MRQKKQYFTNIIFWLFFCLLIAQTVASLVAWYSQVVSLSDLDYAERWQAYIASQAYPGAQHVGSSYEMPYNTIPYPPISYLINGWIGRLVGADLSGIRIIGRTTSLIMTLLNSILIFAIGRKLGVRILWSVIAGLLFLTSQEAQFFAVSLRPDEMGLAFTLLGLYVVLFLDKYRLGGALFALAITTKHSFISVPFVLLIALFVWQKRRAAIELVVSGFLVGLSILLLGTWMLGSYWWQGCLLQGFHGANFKQAIYFIGRGFSQPVLVIGLASVFITKLSNSVGIVAACFLVSLGFNSIALVKVGAAGNYFLEPVALASILSSYLAKQVLDNQRLLWKGFAWTLMLALIIPSTVEQIDMTVKSLKERDNDITTKPVIELLRNIDGPILTDNAGFYFDSGHQPFASPPDLIMAAIEGGKIDGRPMQQFIERKGFNAIVVRNNWKDRPHFPQAWISAIEANYESLKGDYQYNVMKPKGQV